MSITTRALELIEKSSLQELAKAGETDYVRWQNIKRGRARVGAEEVEVLGKVFPQFAYWLTTGEILPECGQISPDYEALQGKASGQN